MILLGSKRRVAGWLLVSGAVLGLAGACGSSDDKKTSQGEAGAAGSDDGGSPGAGGSQSNAGAPSPAEGGGGSGSNGGEATTAGAGASPVGDAGATGDAGAPGAAGAPSVEECVPAGSVTNLSVNPEPIYGGCRGAVLRIPYAVSAAAPPITCCGVSTSDPPFSLTVAGTFNGEDGGELVFQVPDNAPYNTYAIELTCQTQSNDQAITVDIGDSDAPVVLSITAEVTPSSAMLIEGQHLAGVDRVGAFRAADGSYYECNIDAESQTNTAITCDFGGNIPKSVDANDLYFIDVEVSECGHAADPPPFIVLPQPT